jgi:hypothetical protein
LECDSEQRTKIIKIECAFRFGLSSIHYVNQQLYSPVSFGTVHKNASSSGNGPDHNGVLCDRDENTNNSHHWVQDFASNRETTFDKDGTAGE